MIAVHAAMVQVAPNVKNKFMWLPPPGEIDLLMFLIMLIAASASTFSLVWMYLTDDRK
jgi:hypothetical protein